VTTEAIINQAKADGVQLSRSGRGTVKATGDAAAVDKWLPILRDRKAEINAALASDGRDAVDLLTRSGARILPHRHRTIAVPRRHDTDDLRRALALLGYGAYSIVHIGPEFKGQGIAVVEAALQAAGKISC